MFTGLVKAVGTVISLVSKGDGAELCIDISELGQTPEIGASVAVNGACQTVVSLQGANAVFFAARETIIRTNLGHLRNGSIVNLEPSLRVGDPLDGHLVSGHVDAVAKVLDVRSLGESAVWQFSLPGSISKLVASKGSIAVDGISLTVVDVFEDSFTVSLIPHTVANTTLGNMRPGAMVNLEADVLARYVARQLGVDKGVTEDFLRENGFA